MPKPTPQKFLEDPAFQEDRAIFSAFMEAELTRRAKEASVKEKPENIFDQLFGVKKSPEEKTFLQSLFD